MSEQNFSEKPFSHMELSAFCGQMALILKSGISATEGLAIMLEDASSEEEKNILQTLLSDMNESGSLPHALESVGLFPSYMVHMTAIGEETGTLDDVMSALQSHYEREADIARTIKSAVTYPLIMIGMMILVIVVLLVKVMPVFHQVFVQLGTEMTGVSRALMNMGTVINRYAILLSVLLLMIVAFGFYAVRTRSGKAFSRKLGYRIGSIRKIYEEIAACRFASGMALTLSSGLNPDRSMELVRALIDDPFFLRKLDSCSDRILSGEELSSALFSSGIFTGMYARMASIGSKTGAMDQVMNQIASLYQEEIDTRMNNTLAVLEPTLVITLSLIVGVILLSVMLPLMGIMSGI